MTMNDSASSNVYMSQFKHVILENAVSVFDKMPISTKMNEPV